MANIRRCPTCKLLFPTIDAVNYHYKLTSHTPLPYQCGSCERVYHHLSILHTHILSKHPGLPLYYECESCNRVFNTLSILLSHCQSEHPHLPLPYYCAVCQRVFETSSDIKVHNRSKGHRRLVSKTSTSATIPQMDAGEWRDADDRDTDANDWDSPENATNCDTQITPTLREKRPFAVLGNISKPPSSVSESLPCNSSSSEAGPSLSKLDEATALARAALRSRFAELGTSTSGETTPLFNLWGPKKAGPSASNLDGSTSNATNLSLDSSNSNESKLPLDSLDNTTDPFICPGCQIGFKSFSGFVLHIENRLCKSSMCHEIEDQINACAEQLFKNLACVRI